MYMLPSSPALLVPDKCATPLLRSFWICDSLSDAEYTIGAEILSDGM
jgi:hypothetical protein